ncbi:MAG TPA: ABC transporter substrate-binding protein [Petrotoga sp.]|nr:MAG: Extracellular solute-binding protein family 5 [bacterium 42_11]HBT50608.1 ABC transporter substrate-binding protein [Petrotoga sp.]
MKFFTGKKILCLVLALVLVMSVLPGCQKTPTKQEEKQETPAPTTKVSQLPVPREETVVREDPAVFNQFDSFNPYIPNGVEYAAGFWQISAENLFIFNWVTGEIVPWLATGYEYSDDYKTFTLKLRDGVTWNDGQPFTADDVVFTVKLEMSKEELGARAWENVENVVVKDPHTVVFTLKQPDVRFFQKFVNYIDVGWIPLPKHIWEGKDPLQFKNNPPVTTGPYKLKEVIPDLKMFVWERNENYWGKKYGHFPAPKYVVMKSAPSPDAAFQEFINNEVDIPVLASYEQAKQAMKKNPSSSKVEWMDPCPRALWLNCGAGPTSDVRVRYAISYLLDREKIAKAYFQPESTPAAFPLPAYTGIEEKFASKDLLAKYDWTSVYSPEKAAKLLDEAGYKMGPQGVRVDKDGKPVEIEIITPMAVGSTEYNIALSLSEELKKIGINATVRSLDMSVETEKILMGDFNIDSRWIPFYGDPYSIYRKFATKNFVPIGERCTTGNWVRLKDAEWDKVLDELAKVLPDSPGAHEAYVKALELFLKDLPVIPVAQTPYVTVFSTAYWTNWPTQDNMYVVPASHWGPSMLTMILNIKPAKTK